MQQDHNSVNKNVNKKSQKGLFMLTIAVLHKHR
jgi:hypothetical protein